MAGFLELLSGELTTSCGGAAVKPKWRSKRRHEPSETPHEGLEAGWDVTEALRALSPDHRVALMLKEIEGLSYQEIAEAMGWPIGTVGTHIHRARLELKAFMEEKAHGLS